MSNLFVTNVEFEKELDLDGELHFPKDYAIGKVAQQLQYLGLFVAGQDDYVLTTTELPDSFFHSIHAMQLPFTRKELPKCISIFQLTKEKPFIQQLMSWAPSKRISDWARELNMQYCSPDWKLIKELASKEYLEHVELSDWPHSYFIRSEKDLFNWFNSLEGKKVIKLCYGCSGYGHLFVEEGISQSVLKQCRKQWEKGRAVIGEKWVEKVCEFSSQWLIHQDKNPELIGIVAFQTDQQGHYVSSIVGNNLEVLNPWSSFVHQHLHTAQHALENMKLAGFFGYVGIDAMIYKEDSKLHLRHISEINCRMTMSLASLLFQRKWFNKEILQMRFGSALRGWHSLLPEELIINSDCKIRFKNNWQFKKLIK